MLELGMQILKLSDYYQYPSTSQKLLKSDQTLKSYNAVVINILPILPRLKVPIRIFDTYTQIQERVV